MIVDWEKRIATQIPMKLLAQRPHRAAVAVNWVALANSPAFAISDCPTWSGEGSRYGGISKTLTTACQMAATITAKNSGGNTKYAYCRTNFRPPGADRDMS